MDGSAGKLCFHLDYRCCRFLSDSYCPSMLPCCRHFLYLVRARFDCTIYFVASTGLRSKFNATHFLYHCCAHFKANFSIYPKILKINFKRNIFKKIHCFFQFLILFCQFCFWFLKNEPIWIHTIKTHEFNVMYKKGLIPQTNIFKKSRTTVSSALNGGWSG